VSPATVFNQGLLNPNQFNKPQAERFKDSLFGMMGIVPGVGDTASAVESADLFNRGENFAGSLAALGALPLVPAIGGMFVGKGSKTWDVLKAQQAEEMLAKGVDPREVWKQTGTMRGVDNALRQEIPDNLASMESGGRFFGTKGGGGRMSDVMRHDNLYNAYPFTSDINTSYNFEAPKQGGMYDEVKNFIQVDAPMGYQSSKDTTLHELQHAIQQKEGWAVGGSPKDFQDMPTLMRRINENSDAYIRAQENGGIDPLTGLSKDIYENNIQGLKEQADQIIEYGGSPYNAYRSLGGEVEARLTAARMNITPEERLIHYPYDVGQYGIDTPQDKMIIRGLIGDNGVETIKKKKK
jgi:hypothetical protein